MFYFSKTLCAAKPYFDSTLNVCSAEEHFTMASLETVHSKTCFIISKTEGPYYIYTHFKTFSIIINFYHINKK